MEVSGRSDKVISKWTVGTEYFDENEERICPAICKGEALAPGERRRTTKVFFPLGEYDTDYRIAIMVSEKDGLALADFRVIDEITVPIPENVSKDGYSMLYRVYLEASLEPNEEVRVSIKFAHSGKTLTTRIYTYEEMRASAID